MMVPIVFFCLLLAPPSTNALDLADLRLDAPVDLVRSLVGTLISKEDGGILSTMMDVATKTTPIMRLFNLMPSLPKDLFASPADLGIRLFPQPPVSKENLFDAAIDARSRIKGFEDFLANVGQDIKESICTHEQFERGEFIPTGCQGPSLTLNITTGKCTIDTATKRVECVPPRVELIKSPASCNLKYRERCIFIGPQCRISKSFGFAKEGVKKKFPTLEVDIDKVIPLGKKKAVLDDVAGRLSELLFDKLPERKQISGSLEVRKTIPLSLDKDLLAPALEKGPVAEAPAAAAPIVAPAAADTVLPASSPSL